MVQDDAKLEAIIENEREWRKHLLAKVESLDARFSKFEVRFLVMAGITGFLGSQVGNIITLIRGS